MARQITRKQIEDIRKKTRAANRRLERASEGQRKALEWYIGRAQGGTKFSAATKGLTYQEAKKKLKDLDKFLGAKSSKITGWREIKEQQVHNANLKWKKYGYDLTDEELANILIQIETKNKDDYYTAVDLVQAEKKKKGDKWRGTEDEIGDAIDEIISEQKALEESIAAREVQ